MYEICFDWLFVDFSLEEIIFDEIVKGSYVCELHQKSKGKIA